MGDVKASFRAVFADLYTDAEAQRTTTLPPAAGEVGAASGDATSGSAVQELRQRVRAPAAGAAEHLCE